jgi:hypothetical protein
MRGVMNHVAPTVQSVNVSDVTLGVKSTGTTRGRAEARPAGE